jgi:hypothetical protein
MCSLASRLSGCLLVVLFPSVICVLLLFSYTFQQLVSFQMILFVCSVFAALSVWMETVYFGLLSRHPRRFLAIPSASHFHAYFLIIAAFPLSLSTFRSRR